MRTSLPKPPAFRTHLREEVPSEETDMSWPKKSTENLSIHIWLGTDTFVLRNTGAVDGVRWE